MFICIEYLEKIAIVTFILPFYFSGLFSAFKTTFSLTFNRDMQGKACSLRSCAYLLIASVSARVHEKALSLSYHITVVFEQLIPFVKGSFYLQCVSRNHVDH